MQRLRNLFVFSGIWLVLLLIAIGLCVYGAVTGASSTLHAGLGCGAVLILVALAYVAYLYRCATLPTQSFDSNGVPIHYIETGRGVPIILVHGLGLNGRINWIMTGHFQQLARDYRVIAIDTRGHGRSGKPRDPAQYGPEMAEDVVRLMDHLHIDKAHVVGYSMGGFITLKLIAMHPERLLSAAPCGAGWAAHPETDLGFLTDLADSLDAGRGFGLLLNRLEPKDRPPNKLQMAFTDWIMAKLNDIPALAALLRGMTDLAVTEAEIRGNGVPVMGIIGGRDPLKVYADQMANAMTNFEYVVVPGADHLWTPDRPLFMQRLLPFLARNAAGA